MQNKILVLILTLGLFNLAPAQTQHFRATIVKNGSDFSFPILSSNGNSEASTKINQLLQLSELSKLVTRSSKNTFEQVEVDDGTIYGGKVWMNTTVYSNSSRVLSIGFDESSCGMTCTYWHRYYNFNPVNCDLLELRDLFTRDGFQLFSNTIVKIRSSTYSRVV